MVLIKIATWPTGHDRCRSGCHKACKLQASWLVCVSLCVCVRLRIYPRFLLRWSNTVWALQVSPSLDIFFGSTDYMWLHPYNWHMYGCMHTLLVVLVCLSDGEWEVIKTADYKQPNESCQIEILWLSFSSSVGHQDPTGWTLKHCGMYLFSICCKLLT